MESTDAPLLSRVKRAYELGRIRRALFYACLAVPMIFVSELCCCCGRSVSLGGSAVLAAVLFGLTWRGGHLGRGALPGLVAGALPLAAPSLADACGAPSACLPACIAGGLLGGAVIAAWAVRASEGRAPFVFGAGAVAAATGSLGCAMAGSTGVVAMICALAAVSTPVAVKAALAR